MFSQWSAALAAKTKVTALIAMSLAAGGVGGAMALSQVAPSPTTQIMRSADSTPTPTSTDPETTDAQGTGTGTGAGTSGGDPETTDAQGSGSGTDSNGSTGGYTLPPCPADVKSHGDYVSLVARSAPKGKHGEHGKWVSQAAHSDCGKQHQGSDSTDPESVANQRGDAGHSGSAKRKPHGPTAKHDGAPAAGSTDPTAGDSSGQQPAGHGHGGGGHVGGPGHGRGGGHSKP